jgi:HEAT repeat protein
MEYLAFKALNNQDGALVSPVRRTVWQYDTQGCPCLISDGHGIYGGTWNVAKDYGDELYLVVPYLVRGDDPEIVIANNGWRSYAATVIGGPFRKDDIHAMRQVANYILTSYLQGYRQVTGILVWAIETTEIAGNKDFLMPILERAFEEEDQHIRCATMRTASKIGAVAIPLLKRGLDDLEDDVRICALRGLIETGPELEILERAEADYDVRMKCFAVYGARKIGEPAINILKRALKSPSLYVRRATVDDLGTTPPAEIVKMAIEDSDFRVRCLAALMAAKLKTRCALPIIERAIKDHNTDVRQAGIYAANLIGEPARHLLNEME